VTPLPRALFESRLPGLARPLTRSEGESIHNYLILLDKWQRTHRLVGSVNPAWLIENVVLDSLCFLEALPTATARVADLGSGAGLPGIPIAIVRPELTMTLIEPRQRRVSFLSTVIRELGLAHAEVVPSRVQALGPDYTGRFDAVVMRCAGEVGSLRKSALSLVRRGGAVIVSAHSAGPPPPGGERIVVRTFSGTPRAFDRFSKP
jgi:16S rRNA (guanine527-N7)-methyltransferase